MDANAISDSHLPTILLIDDEQDLLVAWALLLELEGFHVVTSYDARKGVELAHRLQPSLIITDLMMPEMDGVEVCIALKNDPALGNVPVILWTSSSDVPPDILCECMLHKPVARETLLGHVACLLRRGLGSDHTAHNGTQNDSSGPPRRGPPQPPT
jgi:two-component system alkaline phosphatase synthesis response regulator PhoP